MKDNICHNRCNIEHEVCRTVLLNKERQGMLKKQTPVTTNDVKTKYCKKNDAVTGTTPQIIPKTK